MKPKYDKQVWTHKLNTLKARIADEEFSIPAIRDLEAACKDKQFREDFCKGSHFDVIRSILEFADKGVMEELRMIGQFNKDLKKELFDSMRVNSKLAKRAMPCITILWLLTTDPKTMDYKMLLSENLMDYVLAWLEPFYVNINFLPEKDKIFGGLLSIIWNSVSNDPDLKFPIRKMLHPYIGTIKKMSQDDYFDQRIMALTCLLLLTDHERKSDFTTTSTDINILVQALQQATRSHGGTIVIHNATYDLGELLVIFINVCENDVTKDILIDMQIVETLLSLLEMPKVADAHKKPVLELLFKLSFKIKGRTGLSDYTQSILEAFCKNNKNKEMSELCQRISFELGQKKRLQEQTKKASDDRDSSSKHVLISYSWSTQLMALKLRNCLRDYDIKVWIDVDNMGPDILSSMAEAVENAYCVLVCISEKYKESSACRSEAEYAYNLRKDVVPIMMEKGYSPTGWLGILCGTKKYYKWFDDSNIASSTPSLVAYLQKHPLSQQMDGESVSIREEIVVESHYSVTNASLRSTHVDFKETFLQNMDKESLTQYRQFFSTYSLPMLMYLQEMEQRTPEFLWKSLQDQYAMSFEDLLRFSSLLKRTKFS